MMTVTLVNTVILILCLSIQDVVADSDGCDSPQYIRIGMVGKIKCSFPDDVFGVVWYNSTDHFQDLVILILEDSTKKGAGFLLGEFDISHGGSLIVHNVSMRHEGTYTVVRLSTPTSKARSYTVNVFVIASTFKNFPVIRNCNSSELCFQILDDQSQLSCTVVDSRQTIPLYWMVRTINGDRNVSSHLSVKNERGSFFTSLVTTTDFFYTPFLTLLVCKAEIPPALLEKNESLVLVQNKRVPTAEPYVEYIEINSRLELNCTERNVLHLVWQRMQPSDRLYYNIFYAVFVGSYSSHNDVEGYQFKNNNSLVVEAVDIHHEGVYRCISGNGLEDDIKVYDVAVFVPTHVAVDGCSHQQYCILEGNAEGSLTCLLKRVRPQVELDFTEIFQESSEEIQFLNKTLNVKDNGDTFDVLLRSRYRYKGFAKTKLTIECKVIRTNITKLQLSRIFELWFEDGAVAPTGETPTTIIYPPWVIPVVVVVGLPCILVQFRSLIKALRKIRKSRHHKTATTVPTFERKSGNNSGLSDCGVLSEEIMPMLPQKYRIEAKKGEFISEMKAKYQDLFEVVQPIPFIRDRLYCIDRVFVEGGIEYLVAKNKIGGEERWEKLDKYQNILTDDRVTSKRRIIEGEPGYGKSSLTLQFAYDWCNGINISYLKNIDVLIILRLRQLRRETSIYRAIRMFLLPKDTQLSEKDIELILSQSSSTLVVLDGYDEYPDKYEDTECDVISIITRNMFQKIEVILTTRSSYLPKDFPAQTKRLRLTGFDDNARDQYIRKAVVGNDTHAVDKIKQRLQENDVLEYVCQVPYFFVMFAHMSHENENFQQLDSVTKFFRYMISCFHSHMKNKMKDENVAKFDLFETDHKELDMIAFERLTKKDHKTVWKKEDLCTRLGKDFYNQYVRLGILHEEEVLDISDFPGSPDSEHIQYKTEVRFYHKIFCEWYAAHYLSRYLSRDDFGTHSLKQSENYDLDDYGHFLNRPKIITDKGLIYLENLDPFEHQYVYLFTCGLSSEPVSNEIIRYLQTKKETRQFVILCIFEQKRNVDDILEYVEYICKEGFAISNGHSLLLQRSTIQLMKISSKHKLAISSITLTNCYSALDLSSKCIRLKSSLSLPVLHNLNAIEIWESGKIMEKDEFANIVCFAAMCNELRYLTLSRCVVPQFNTITPETTAILRSREVKVYWWPRIRYRLNLDSFLWEDTDKDMVITDEEYQSEVTWCTTVQES